MFLVSVTRNEATSLKRGGVSSFVQEGKNVTSEQNEIGAWIYFSDLTGRYMELCNGYEYTERFGNQYPLKIISLVFSPIPFVPNIVNNLIYGVPLSATSPGGIVGRETDTHAGSHCVLGTYMPWGLAGTIIMFWLFGYVVSIITINSRKNIYGAACYLTIVAYAVFTPRASITDIYRPLIWTLFIIYLLKGKSS